MSKAILLLSLLILPLLPYTLKEPFALFFICCGFVTLPRLKGPMKQNPWLSALFLFLPISIYNAPPIHLLIGGQDLGGLWMWRALALCFGYYVLYLIFSNICYSERFKKRVAYCIAVPTVVVAIYALFQAMGWDQWQYIRAKAFIFLATNANITSTIGNPTYLAVYLATGLPFVWLCCPWYLRILTMAAIVVCHSDTAFYGILFSVGLYATIFAYQKYRTVFYGILFFLSLALIAVCIGFEEGQLKVNINGRQLVWQQTLEDWNAPAILVKIDDKMSLTERSEAEGINKKAYQITGRGLGSFQYLFPVKHPGNLNPNGNGEIISAPWVQAHNEPLESLYSVGAVGVFLILMALGFVLVLTLPLIPDAFFACVWITAFFGFLSSLTLPVWHEEPLRFLNVAVLSILSSLILQRKRPPQFF